MRHYSGIDYDHFLDDIRDMYPFSIEEAIIVELIANALDAKTSLIDIRVDPERNLFELTDNGEGMTKRGFEMYHNFSTSFKRKGQGIGFAGLGAKLSLKIASSIVTETRTKSHWGASEWKFERRSKAMVPVWYDSDLRELPTQGTRVRINGRKKSGILSSADAIRRIVLAHYLPLLTQQEFYESLRLYRRVTFLVNGELLQAPDFGPARSSRQFIMHRGASRKPFALACFVIHEKPLPEETQGVGISTFGKVVKRDYFKQFFPDMDRVTGIIEVPELVECLTTNKCEFRREGYVGNKYYRFQKIAQREFRRWLEELNLVVHSEVKPDKEIRRLQRVVNMIVGEIPDLQQFYGSRGERSTLVKEPGGLESGSLPEPLPGADGSTGPGNEQPSETAERMEKLRTLVEGEDHSASRRVRAGRFGPVIQYASVPDRREISWMDGDTVLINTAHPTYAKALEKKVEEYHNLIAAAMAMLREVPTAQEKLQLLENFMSQWGKL